MEGNDTAGNAMWGVLPRAGADSGVRRNRINRNGNEAVLVHGGARATIEDNDLTGNARGPWSIARDCEPNVTRARNKQRD